MEQIKRKSKKSKIFKAIRIILWISILFISIYIGISAYKLGYGFVLERNSRKELQIDVSVPEGNELEIDIPSGSATSDIAEILFDNGLIENKFLFSLWSKVIGYENKYLSGIHIVNKNEDFDALEKYEKLMYIMSQPARQNPTVYVTIPEGYTFEQIAELLSRKGVVDKDKFYEAADTLDLDYDFVKLIPDDPDRTNRLEGYLFPETYIFDTLAGEEVALKKMLDVFENKFKDIYKKAAQELDMTIDEIIIIASIIEREAKAADERDRIAGVIYNRLNSSYVNLHKLQLCSTIQYYFLQTTGHVKENLTNADLTIQDPYNTYLYAGLPPGPISNPGLASIIAALYPENNTFYYFVAMESGNHHFSSSYEDHLWAVNHFGT